MYVALAFCEIAMSCPPDGLGQGAFPTIFNVAKLGRFTLALETERLWFIPICATFPSDERLTLE